MTGVELQVKEFSLGKDDYCTIFRSNRIQKAIKLIPSSAQSILDVGCGAAILRTLTRTKEVHAIDITHSNVALAKYFGYASGLVLDAFVDRFPFDDGAFDCVFCSEVIEHGIDTDHFLSEIHRVLSDNGTFVLTFPNIRTPIGIAMMLLNMPPMGSAKYQGIHVRDFTTKSIRQALKNNGFTLEKMVGCDFCISRNPIGILPSLAHYLPSWSSTVALRAIK